MRVFISLGLLIISLISNAQKQVNQNDIPRPRLVVGIVVDQMRWDYLYRYYDRYSTGGFRRLLHDGFSCENTLIPYAPTVTAVGHSCIYTGSVPAFTGITGNSWWDRLLQKSVYCVEDNQVAPVGSNATENGKMSPRNLLVTTVSDELRLATNFRGKVIGVALKDRGSILPAGHAANAAYWYDPASGKFITSSFYLKVLPQWVNTFNDRKLVDQYYSKGWSTLYPLNTYLQSAPDAAAYESKPFGNDQLQFPYDLSRYVTKDYSKIATTPFGNTLTVEMAEAAIQNEQLGNDDITDMLCLSFSSTDYVGHAFGPNSVEAEDVYLRLDQELQRFFNYLDTKVGKGAYTVFLSADHGVAHVPGFLNEHHLPNGVVNEPAMLKDLNARLRNRFGVDSLFISTYNYQLHLNPKKITASVNKDSVISDAVGYLNQLSFVSYAFDIRHLNEVPLNATLRTMLNNGYYYNRSGDVQLVLKSGFIAAGSTGTTHGLWNPYDAHIPLLWYGWGIQNGKTNRETYMTDIAATVAALLHIQMPSGCVGKVITEVIK